MSEVHPLPERSMGKQQQEEEDSVSFSYVDEEAVDCDLKCPICYEPLSSPQVCQTCRHTFCRKCVSELTRCAMCRGSVHPLQEPPRLILNLLAKLPVKCNACSKELKSGEFQHHIHHECPIPCPIGCGQRITRASAASHKDQCPSYILPCPATDVGCTYIGPRVDTTEHADSCPFLSLRPLLQAYQNRIIHLETQVKDLERQLPEGQTPHQKIPLMIKFKRKDLLRQRLRLTSSDETSDSDPLDEEEDTDVAHPVLQTLRRSKRLKI